MNLYICAYTSKWLSLTLKGNLKWFIRQEKDRTLFNVENGTIGKEQATGSLSTLYKIAAAIEDKEYMMEISRTIAVLRSERLDSKPRGLEFKRIPWDHLQLSLVKQ